MKRKKTIIILIALLVVFVGIIIAEKTITRHVDKINTVDEVIFEISPENLDGIKWKTSDGEGLEFQNIDGKWVCLEDENFPVDQDAFSDFLSHFKSVHASFIIEDVEDFAQYGLSNEECLISFKTSDGESTMKLGGYSVMDSKRYINLGEDTVYLVDDDLYNYISNDKDDFMKHDVAPNFDIVNSVVTGGSAAVNAVLDEEGEHTYNDKYTFYNLVSGNYQPLDTSKMETLISRLTELKNTDYATYTATSDGLEKYGMDKPEITFTVSGKDSDEKDLYFTFNVSSVDTGEKDEDDQEIFNYYCRFDESDIIYNLSQSNYEYFSAVSYNTLRPAFVLNMNWEDMESMSVILEDKTYVISKELPVEENEEDTSEDASDNTSEEEVKFYINGTEIDVSEIESQLDYLAINTFTDEKAEKPLELSFTINLSNEQYPSFKVDIYQYNGDDCLVYLNGNCLGLMSRTLAVALEESVNKIVLSL